MNPKLLAVKAPRTRTSETHELGATRGLKEGIACATSLLSLISGLFEWIEEARVLLNTFFSLNSF